MLGIFYILGTALTNNFNLFTAQLPSIKQSVFSNKNVEFNKLEQQKPPTKIDYDFKI